MKSFGGGKKTLARLERLVAPVQFNEPNKKETKQPFS